VLPCDSVSRDVCSGCSLSLTRGFKSLTKIFHNDIDLLDRQF
jgi:hypothetical protein